MGWVGAGTRSPALPNNMCARSPMDTASDYGSEEWEFKSLRAHHKLSAVRSTDRTFDFGSINRGSNPLPRTIVRKQKIVEIMLAKRRNMMYS